MAVQPKRKFLSPIGLPPLKAIGGFKETLLMLETRTGIGLKCVVAIVAVPLLFLLPIRNVYPLDLPEIRAAQWLATPQNLDGSWGIDEGIKPLYTTSAVLALASVHQRNAAYHKGIAWLENHHVPNVDYKARRILALGSSGGDVEQDLEYLRSAADLSPVGNSGWGLTPAYTGSPTDTALVLQAFALVGDMTNVPAALTFLKATQLTGTSKGWAVSYETANDPAVASDPIATAQVVRALVRYAAGDPSLATPIANAVATLQAGVDVSSPALVKAHTALALLEQNVASAHGQILLASLRSTQLTSGTESGSWEGDVYTTALAMQALARASGAALVAQDDLVFIPDINLRGAINLALGKNRADALTKGELAQLTELNAGGLGIQDLTGLEWAVNLRSADFSNNAISDISPLQNLTSLADLNLEGNPISALADSDGDGAFDAEEAFAGTHPFDPTSHPVFHVEADVLNLDALRASLGPVAALTDAWHAVWEDFDGDGDLDAVVYVHGADEQFNGEYDGPTRGQLWLFERLGGSYVQRTLTQGEDRPNGDVSELFAFDYDNDGMKDLLLVLHPVTTLDSFVDSNDQHRDLVLLKGSSGTTLRLTDVTQVVGLPDPALTQAGTRSAAVVDMNGDGYLDILVTSPGSSKLWQFDPAGGTYADAMPTTGLPSNLCCGFVTVDLDNDGFVDLISQGGSTVLRLFRNTGDESFVEMVNQFSSSLAPLADLNSITRIVPADYNRDGRQDLVVFLTQLAFDDPVTFAGGTIQLVKNLTLPGQFNVELETGISGFDHSGSTSDFSYGGAVGDIDNDADLDFLITGLAGTDWTTLYRDTGGGSYTRLGARTNIRKNGNRAPSFGDVNQDGMLDLLLPSGFQGGFADYLYTNIEAGNHFLDVNVVGGASGRNANGALVKVVAGGVTQWQQVLVASGRGHLLHFGLGTATSADVTVFWPAGAAPTTITVSPVDRTMSITEP